MTVFVNKNIVMRTIMNKPFAAKTFSIQLQIYKHADINFRNT
jgi:hypothetical protein